jgi:phosphohistidine phosphatase
MDLILWRHAEAEEGSDTLPDMKRRLTARGEKQARQMAIWLAKHLPKKTRILVSPAERTQQTAHPLQRPYELEKKVGPGGTADDLLAAVTWPDHDSTFLVIGHQPTLGQVAARLLGGTDGEWTVKKGGVWWISHRMRGPMEQTVLRAVMNPDFL